MDYEAAIRAKLSELEHAQRYRRLERGQGVSFSHNDYLGLSGHPRIVEAGLQALHLGATGSRGSRLLGGNSLEVERAEARIADFFGAPSALFFSSGYLANLAAVTVAATLVEHIVSDESNHASLIDGIRLSALPKTIVPHQQWPVLGGRALLVAESLYSMDGDCVAASSLRSAWGASHFLVLDEAHAAGVFLEKGRGLSEGWRDFSRMAVTVTFGKAFGVGGAAVLCSSAFRELLINTARSFIYTTASCPVVPAMVVAALEVGVEEGWRREELWDRAVRVRQILRSGGVPLLPAASELEERSPIVPVLVPGEDNALRFSQLMRKCGVDVRAIRYPTVPRGRERIRISLNLAVSRDNTEAMAKEMVRQWTAFLSSGSTRA